MKNLPEKIYLQIGEDCPDDADFKELKEVTWSTEQIFKNDIVFEIISDSKNLIKPDFDGNCWSQI